MGMTRTQMLTALRGIIAEPSEDRFPDDDDSDKGIGLNTWLNIGTKRYFADTKWAKSHWQIAVSGSDTYSNSNRIYSMPSDCLEINREDVTFDDLQIEAITRKELHSLDEDYDETDASDTKWIETVGTPTHIYMEKEDVYGLYPTPDADNDAKNLKFTGIEAPDDYSGDSSECPLPYDLCMGPVHWAAWQVFTNDNDPRATIQLQLYNTSVARGMERKRTRERQQPKKMKTSRQYYVNPNSWVEKSSID